LSTPIIRPGVKAFIFDLDGTLIDSVDAHVTTWVKAFKVVVGISVDEGEVYPLIGMSGRDIVRKILGKVSESEYAKIRWVKDRAFMKELKGGRVTLFPGVTQALRILKKEGYLIGMASSTPNRLLLHIIDYLGITDFFDAVTGGDEVRRGKPDPEIFLRAMKKLGVVPEETVVVGDTAYDVCPAHRIGAIPVLVNTSRMPDGIVVATFRMFHELTEALKACLLRRNCLG
jgi:HAD superfamily hydrolase (TIGR01509 family)